MSKHRVDRASKRRTDPRLRTLLRWVDAHGFAWDDLANDVLPIFERARPFAGPVDPPALMILPPGVTVGFGVDAGPAFMRIATTHLAGWPVDLAGLAARALDNLAHRTLRADRRDVARGYIGDVSVDIFQSGDGWASTTVLVPDALGRLFGREPTLFVAPTRDVLIAMPADVDLAFATRLTEEVEADDPNALSLEAFEWRDGTVRCRPLLRAGVAV